MTSNPSQTSATSGHDIFVTTLGELVGISVLAVIADQSDNFGKIAVALMGGWLLVFLITNTSWLQAITGKL